MILPYGFFSGFGRPMAEPAPVRASADAPAAPAPQSTQPDTLDERWKGPGPAGGGARRPFIPGLRPRGPVAFPFPVPGAGAGGSGGRGGRTPGASASGSAGGGSGGGRVVDTTAYPTPGADSGSGAAAGGGGGGDTGLSDAEVLQILNALADGTAPAEYQQYLQALIDEAVKRGLEVPAKFRSMIPTGTSSSAPKAAAGGGNAALLLAGAGGGFLVAGPLGAAVGAAAALLLGRK